VLPWELARLLLQTVGGGKRGFTLQPGKGVKEKKKKTKLEGADIAVRGGRGTAGTWRNVDRRGVNGGQRWDSGKNKSGEGVFLSDPLFGHKPALLWKRESAPGGECGGFVFGLNLGHASCETGVGVAGQNKKGKDKGWITRCARIAGVEQACLKTSKQAGGEM